MNRPFADLSARFADTENLCVPARGSRTLEDRWPMQLLLTVSAATLGFALLIKGTYDPAALSWLTAALVLCAIALSNPQLSAWDHLGPKLVTGVLCTALAFETFIFVAATPPKLLNFSSGWKNPGLLVFAIMLAVGFAVGGIKRRYWFPLLVVAHTTFAAHAIFSVPPPVFDVLVFQREAATALLNGVNPFAITYPDLYGPSSPYTIPGTSVNGRINFGFNYPPLSLLMILPAVTLGVDLRITHLIAITLSAMLIAYSRPSRQASLAAALLLLMPSTITVAYLSWTEPFPLLMLSAAVFFACRRRPATTAVFVCLMVVAKQHLVITLPALSLLFWQTRGRVKRSAIYGIGAAAIVNVPFFLWNPPAFIRALTVIVVERNFRLDALTYLSWLAHQGGPTLPSIVGLLAALAATFLAVRRAPHTPSGYAAAVGFVTFVFFAFNVVGFTNYYYFSIGAMCCAIAAASPKELRSSATDVVGSSSLPAFDHVHAC